VGELVRDAEGRGRCAVGTIQDITERKRAEERLAAATAELERRRERERQGVEIHDNVVQGLAVAHYALQRGDAGAAAAAVEETLGRARALVGALLGDAPPVPGDLRRSGAAGSV
jgi:signal transduction histidine kinase